MTLESNSELYKNEQWLREQYIDKERSMNDIGDEVGVTDSSIDYWLNKHDIPTRTKAEAKSNGDISKLQDEDWLYQHYVVEELTGPEIADRVGVDNDTVYNYLERHGIEIRDSGISKSNGDLQKLRDEAWLREQYVVEERGMKDIGDSIGVSDRTVWRYLMRHDIETRKSPSEITDVDRSEINDREYLRELHHERQLTGTEMAEILGCRHETVYRKMAEFGIERIGQCWRIKSGEEHPQFKPKKTDNYGPNWHDQKLKARIRDQARCQYCGLTDAQHIQQWNRVNHVHHIEARDNFIDENGVFDYEAANLLSNLITLCERHHQKLEGVPIDNRHFD